MIIKSLELADFRNYDSLHIDFSSGTNILYGDNAQGKTNILEAIYLSATTKSHKGSKDRDVINFYKDESHIRTYLEKEDIEIRVDMHLRKHRRTEDKKGGGTARFIECSFLFTGRFEHY